jgi:hypothetical protein
MTWYQRYKTFFINGGAENELDYMPMMIISCPL